MVKETTKQSVILWFILGCLWFLVVNSLDIPVEITYVLFPSQTPVGLVDNSEAYWRGAISAVVLITGFVPYCIVYSRRKKWLKLSATESKTIEAVKTIKPTPYHSDNNQTVNNTPTSKQELQKQDILESRASITAEKQTNEPEESGAEKSEQDIIQPEDMNNLVERENIVFKKFSNDPFSGNVKYINDKGLLVTGSYNEGLKDGDWIAVDEKNRGTLVSKERYVKGELSGSLENYHANGQLKTTGQIKKQKEEGLWKYFGEGGNLEKKIHFKDGKKEGNAEYYFENGNLDEIGNYKNDYKEGLWKTYYENGTLKSTGKYKSDIKDGTWTSYFENSGQREIEHWSNGELSGDYRSFYENGNTKEDGTYYKGKKDGIWTEFKENGSVKFTEQFMVAK